jgi:hypothetical protein
LLALVRAAFFAAAERFRGPFVRAACLAAAERWEVLRFLAAVRAWFESALWETVVVLSFFNAFSLARERFFETGVCCCPFL